MRGRIITKFRLCARGLGSGRIFSGNKAGTFFFFFSPNIRLLPPHCPGIGQCLFGHSLSTLLTPGVPLRNRPIQFAHPSWLLQRGSHLTPPVGSVPGTSTPTRQLQLHRESAHPTWKMALDGTSDPPNQLPLDRASPEHHDMCTICGQTCQPVSLGSHPQQSWPNQTRGYTQALQGIAMEHLARAPKGGLCPWALQDTFNIRSLL